MDIRGAIGLASLGAVMLAACGGSSHQPATPGLSPSLPTIVSFSVNPPTVEVGAASVLRWSVVGADSISIDQGIGSIQAGALFQTRPTSPGRVTYTLSASNAGGTVTSTVDLDSVRHLQSPPPPTSFSATFAGFNSVLVTWTAEETASGYALERSSSSNPGFAALATTAGDRYWYLDSSTNANELYTYRLQSVNSAGASGPVQASSISAPIFEAPPPPVVVPGNPAVPRGGTLEFAANEPVTWRLIDGPGAGTIDANGKYVAPAKSGVYWAAVQGRNTLLLQITVQ